MRHRWNRALLWYIRTTPVKYKRAGIYTHLIEPGLKSRPMHTVATSRFGARFVCNTEDVIQRNLYAFGVWEPPLTAFVQSRLQHEDTFVDVGANIGYYSLLASSLVGPSGRVVAIEPSPSIHEELRRNLLLNGTSNVRAIADAASDAIGVASMYRASDANRGSSSLLASRGFEVEAQVPTAPLTGLLTTHELSTARIIKIDVEGHEGAVIAGLLPALAKTRPDLEILMEVSAVELLEHGLSSGGLVAQLRGAGFHAYRIENYYEPHRYIEGSIPGHALRLTSPPVGPVAWDLVFSREDRNRLPVELV